MPMKPRRIVREKEACARLACGRTKFREDYKLNDPADPYIPGTETARVKPIPLGPVNVGFLEHELDALIDALAEAGGHSESKAKNWKAARSAALGARLFLTDTLPARLERERSELLEHRNRLRAQLIGDPDPETKSEIEEIERALRALDPPQK
jgi:hypothetical protein